MFKKNLPKTNFPNILTNSQSANTDTHCEVWVGMVAGLRLRPMPCQGPEPNLVPDLLPYLVLYQISYCILY